MAYLAVLSASVGRRHGVAAAMGVALGLMIVGLAAAVGLTTLIAGSRWLYEALRWAGMIYLLWLASEGWRGEKETSPGKATVPDDSSRYFMRGLVTNLLNPKAGVFYIAVLPTFIDGSRPLLGQMIALSLVYVAIATVVHLGIVLLADRARPWLEDERRRNIARRAFSVLLVGIANLAIPEHPLWFSAGALVNSRRMMTRCGARLNRTATQARRARSARRSRQRETTLKHGRFQKP